MNGMTRRELLRRAGTAAVGGAALTAAPAMVSRALARVATGHCGWGAYVDPKGGDTTVAIQRLIQEFGSVGRDACSEHDPLSRAQWLYGAADTITSWKEIEAVVYSHTAAEYNGQPLTFRVDAAATSLRAYRDVGSRAYFN